MVVRFNGITVISIVLLVAALFCAGIFFAEKKISMYTMAADFVSFLGISSAMKKATMLSSFDDNGIKAAVFGKEIMKWDNVDSVKRMGKNKIGLYLNSAPESGQLNRTFKMDEGTAKPRMIISTKMADISAEGLMDYFKSAGIAVQDVSDRV